METTGDEPPAEMDLIDVDNQASSKVDACLQSAPCVPVRHGPCVSRASSRTLPSKSIHSGQAG